MNRKERRAAHRGRARVDRSGSQPAPAASVADFIALAASQQKQGRHREAVDTLRQALRSEPDHIGAHDSIARSYEALGRQDDAIRHFSHAISSRERGIETVVKQGPAMMGPIGRFVHAYPRPLPLAELLGPDNAVADDARLLALLQTEIVRDVELELFLTAVRRALIVMVAGEEAPALAEEILDFACGVAQQCFLNEYVFAVSDPERDLVTQLHDRVVEAGVTSAPAALAVLGCYLPLGGLSFAASLAGRSWPKAVDMLLTRQVREPLAEAADMAAIPALTAIDDIMSAKVRQQYEENPYPRWTLPLPCRPTTLGAFLRDRFELIGAFAGDILIAGCGTGEQSIDTARNFPQSKVLAIDISRASLAYARRKTREFGVRNVEYAQADILKLGSLDRRFDLIESVGVLHHMADPEAGWRALLPLLQPGGVMRIALYSERGRRPLDRGRALIADRGYRPTADDIRAWRQELIWRGEALSSSDFFNISSCRDLCFHVMEHRLTLPRIKRFLAANGLSLLGLETSAETMQQFMQAYPEPGAAIDLDQWDAFEQAHPHTFANMYYLWVRSRPLGGLV